MEWNGTEKLIEIFAIKTMFTGVYQYLAKICPYYFLRNRMEWNGTQKLLYMFGIKTMFTGVSQS